MCCSPFFGEEYRFRVPRDFQRLSFYLCEPGLRIDSRLGKVAISHRELQVSPSSDEVWHSIRPIDADSEVQVWCVCVCELHVSVMAFSYCVCTDHCLDSPGSLVTSCLSLTKIGSVQ